MEAMEYEWLLRRVCNCGRNYNNGTDADIYRKMEKAYNALTMPQIRERAYAEYKYQSAFAVVRNHISKALDEGINQIKYQASDSEVWQLRGMQNRLDHDFYDKQGLDAIVHQADDIFHKYGLAGK